MLLNGNQIYTLMCETKRHEMMVASDNYEEVMSEAMVLCKACLWYTSDAADE